MAEAIIDLFEVVEIDEVEDKVALGAVAAFEVGANGLGNIALDVFEEESAIAGSGKRIGGGGPLEDEVGVPQFEMQKLLLQEDEPGHGEHDESGDDDPEVNDLDGQAGLEDRKDDHHRKREDREDRQASYPGAVVFMFIGFAIEAEAGADDREQHVDGPRGEVGDVVPTAHEVGILFDGAVFESEPEIVEENCTGVEKVEAAPVNLSCGG